MNSDNFVCPSISVYYVFIFFILMCLLLTNRYINEFFYTVTSQRLCCIILYIFIEEKYTNIAITQCECE